VGHRPRAAWARQRAVPHGHGGVQLHPRPDRRRGAGRGTCAWSDADGDRVYTDYSGALTADGVFNGMNQYTGGTGKFMGVTGKAPFQCKALSAQGHFGCTQQFEYRLP
jgi:hypothetical protein